MTGWQTGHFISGTFARPLRAAGFAIAMLAAGCGITYQSPKITERDDGLPVTIVDMTIDTIKKANATPYTPKTLPSVFYAAAGGGSGYIGAGAIPPTPYLPNESRETQQYRPLPNVQPTPYEIGVGDVLLLATRGSGSTVEQLTGLLAVQNQRQGYTVRDDGTIAIPEIGPVQLAGMSLQEAEDRLFQVLVDNQLDPTFSLEVREFNSQRVAVGGAVKNATVVPIGLNRLTLSEALASAGGLAAKDAEFTTIRIYRDGNLYQIPVDMFKKRPELQKAVLLNGDAVFVDTTYDLDRALEFYEAQISVIALRSGARSQALQAVRTEVELQRSALSERRDLFTLREQLGAQDRDYVYLAGEVNNQARVPLPYNQTATLADVLYGQGGFDSTTGNPAEIYVVRDTYGSKNAITAYHLNAKNAADLIIATKFEMRPNDVVFIEEQPITKWNRALQQAFPTIANAATSAALTAN